MPSVVENLDTALVLFFLIFHSDSLFHASFIKVWMEFNDSRMMASYYNRFPLRVFKWTSTFEMWFIPLWTNRFKPHPHTRHLSGLTSSPFYNVACLLTFAWRLTRIAMTFSAEIWRFWLFQTLRYVWFNSKYLENRPSYVKIENWYLTDNI